MAIFVGSLENQLLVGQLPRRFVAELYRRKQAAPVESMIFFRFTKNNLKNAFAYGEISDVVLFLLFLY